MLAEQFLATIQNVITWIDETSEKVNCTLPSDQDQLIDFSSTFQALNREVSAKETSIDLLIEKGAMLLTEGWSFYVFLSKEHFLNSVSYY